MNRGVVAVLSILLASGAHDRTVDPPGPLANEKRIVEAERTADVSVFRALLGDECVMIGPDGKRHDKAEILEIIGSMPPQVVSASDFMVVPAGHDAAVVNYVVDATLPDGSHRRHTASSVWVHRGADWRLVFHQGTPIPQ